MSEKDRFIEINKAIKMADVSSIILEYDIVQFNPNQIKIEIKGTILKEIYLSNNRGAFIIKKTDNKIYLAVYNTINGSSISHIFLSDNYDIKDYKMVINNNNLLIIIIIGSPKNKIILFNDKLNLVSQTTSSHDIYHNVTLLNNNTILIKNGHSFIVKEVISDKTYNLDFPISMNKREITNKIIPYGNGGFLLFTHKYAFHYEGVTLTPIKLFEDSNIYFPTITEDGRLIYINEEYYLILYDIVGRNIIKRIKLDHFKYLKFAVTIAGNKCLIGTTNYFGLFDLTNLTFLSYNIGISTYCDYLGIVDNKEFIFKRNDPCFVTYNVFTQEVKYHHITDKEVCFNKIKSTTDKGLIASIHEKTIMLWR